MPANHDLPTKLCASCGRRFAWRKKWERDWDAVRYCSNACKARGINREDAALEAAILQLLSDRKPGTSICPSEAARAIGPEDETEAAWRERMEPARRAARRLANAGRVIITQKGKAVDPSEARGPIRIALR
ncbi:MAG: DUF2256 and DUF3253 domain-containing protein [Phycisphaerales bacterium]|nr:MAG: DUF2256 and DUF3253 domain-containing protein [Phycisphaerales bacterium]